MNTVFVGRKYKHYKGGLYLVLHLAHHHETRREMVVYVSLERGTINVRPLHGTEHDPDGFMSPVGPDGPTRFRLVDE